MLLTLSQGHPYRAQQLASHAFELCGDEADEETAYAASDTALREAEPEFRAILDTMERPRRAVLVALCKEPTSELHSRPCMQRPRHKGFGLSEKRARRARRLRGSRAGEGEQPPAARRPSARPLGAGEDGRRLAVPQAREHHRKRRAASIRE